MKTESLSIEERVRQAAKRLQRALRDVLDAAPGAWNGPSELLRVLGVQTSLGSRLLAALSLDDPLATLMRLPKSNGLKLVLRGATQAKVPKALIEDATKATREIDEIVRFSGGQADFDAMLAGWLPEGRLGFELRNRQAAFRAMSNLKGLAADAILRTSFVYPGENPERCDTAAILGPVGLRRLRAGAEVQVTVTREVEAAPIGPASTTLDGHPLDENPGSSALVEFCEPSPPRIRCVHHGHAFQRILAGDHVGPESRCTLLFGEAQRNALRRYGTPDRPLTGGFQAIDIPTKMLILDFLIHEDVWPGCEPELRVYDFSTMGTANPNDPSRDIDRRRVPESVQYLGRDVSGFTTSEIGRYIEMLRHVSARLGWDIERFRGFRCRMPYPVHATQVCMVFSPPVMPKA